MIIYVPIEIFSRELDSWEFFAERASEQDVEVLVCSKRFFFSSFKFLPSGWVLLKSLVDGEYELLSDISCYHRLASIDIEGLVPSNGVSGVKLRFSQRTIELVEWLGFWGQKQLNDVRSVFPTINPDKFEVVGHPMLDLWKSQSKGRSATKIIFASSFPFVLPQVSSAVDDHFQTHAFGTQFDKQLLSEIKRDRRLQKAHFEYFCKCVKSICESDFYKTHEVILRPHPLEDSEFWKKELAPYVDAGRIKIDDGGLPFSEVLKNTAAVFHFNSTISVQCRLKGIMAIFLLQRENQSYQDRISGITRAASDLFEADPLELPQWLGEVLEGPMSSRSMRLRLAEHVYDNSLNSSCDAIIRLCGQRMSGNSFSITKVHLSVSLGLFYGNLCKDFLKAKMGRWIGGITKKPRYVAIGGSWDYGKKKIGPGMTLLRESQAVKSEKIKIICKEAFLARRYR